MFILFVQSLIFSEAGVAVSSVGRQWDSAMNTSSYPPSRIRLGMEGHIVDTSPLLVKHETITHPVNGLRICVREPRHAPQLVPSRLPLTQPRRIHVFILHIFSRRAMEP